VRLVTTTERATPQHRLPHAVTTASSVSLSVAPSSTQPKTAIAKNGGRTMLFRMRPSSPSLLLLLLAVDVPLPAAFFEGDPTVKTVGSQALTSTQCQVRKHTRMRGVKRQPARCREAQCVLNAIRPIKQENKRQKGDNDRKNGPHNCAKSRWQYFVRGTYLQGSLMVAWHGVKEVDAPTSHLDGRASASDNIHHSLRFSTPSKLWEH
jgi:hypothetical protein